MCVLHTMSCRTYAESLSIVTYAKACDASCRSLPTSTRSRTVFYHTQPQLINIPSSIPLLPYLLNIDIVVKRSFARAPYATTTTIMTYVSKIGIRMALYVLSKSIKYSA